VLQRKEKEEEEEPQVASVAMLSEYEPVDSEGNPWWEPPQSDFWEGPAWNVSFPVQFAEAFFYSLLEPTIPVVMLPNDVPSADTGLRSSRQANACACGCCSVVAPCMCAKH